MVFVQANEDFSRKPALNVDGTSSWAPEWQGSGRHLVRADSPCSLFRAALESPATMPPGLQRAVPLYCKPKHGSSSIKLLSFRLLVTAT